MTKQEIIEHKKKKFNKWLDNSNPYDLGILQWSRELMEEYVPNKSPMFHVELLLNLFALFDPSLINKYERLFELIGFRGSAKSTVANGIFLEYIIANNGKTIKILKNFTTKWDKEGKLLIEGGEVVDVKLDSKFIVVISETASMAESFVERLRDEFTINTKLKYYYKVAVKAAVDDTTGRWTKSAFKINGCFILGIGTGQQIRGRIKGASRPDFVVLDDIYSEKNTLTEESRQKIKDWFSKAMFNSIDDLRGKVALLGTIVHDDTVLVQMENNPRWRTVKRALMPVELFHKFVEEHIKINRDLALATLPFEGDKNAMLKQREYFDNVQKSFNWQLAWEDRANLYFIALKYYDAIRNRDESGFYQEYFHITRSPSERRFKREYFIRSEYEYKYEFGYSWLKIDDEWFNCEVQFGIDLASGFGKDEAVITIGAILANNRIVILNQLAGKFITRDDVRNDYGEDTRLNKVMLDRSRIEKIGIVDESFRLSRTYHPSTIKIGMAGQEVGTIYQFKQVFEANHDYITYIKKMPQTAHQGQKTQRILNSCVGYYETRMVSHNVQLTELEYQLEYLGKSDMDDRADSASVFFTDIEVPQPMDHKLFDVQDSSMQHVFGNRNPEKWDWKTN